MSKFYIYGPTKLSGEINISGSKNSALPILFSTLLTEQKIKIYNIPKIKDIEITLKILNYLGVKIKNSNNFLNINPKNIEFFCVPNELTKNIRASIWLLGILVTRFGKSKIFFPGGCKIGYRPIDLHIFGLKKLGVNIKFTKYYIKAYIKNKLIGNNIFLNKKSVGATITIIHAAILAKGKTVIKNASLEPEIVDVANFLNVIGANIKGAGTNIITIIGVNNLKGGKYKIISDRIEAGTYLVAAAISKSNILCKNIESKNVINIIKKLKESGAEIKIGENWINLNMNGNRPKALIIKTAPYPGFPTDMQSQFTLLNMVSYGNGIITENIFENRFMHVSELIRMGAQATIKNNKIFSYGKKKLIGSKVKATDLRSAVSLVLAGCIAEGKTIVECIQHIDRGYESIEKKLISIGANIKRINDI